MSGAVPSNNPTGYLGLPERNPPDIITTTRDPLTTDYKNVKLGDFWFNKTTHKFWVLVSIVSNSAVWDPFAGPTAANIDTLTGDSGGVVTGDTNGNVNLLGAAGQIVVTGSPSTNTLTVSLAGGGTAIDSFQPDSGTNPVVPTAAGLVTMAGSGSITTVGGTNTLTTQLTGLTNHAVLVGAGTSTITKVGPSSTTGAPLLGAGASADPAYSTTFTVVDSTGVATLSKSAAGSVITIAAQNTAANTALISSTANSSGNGAGFFSSGQYDTTKYWNFGMVPTNAGTNAGGYNVSYNTSGQSDPSAGTPTLRIDTTGNATVPAGDLTVSRGASLPEVVVTQTGGTDFARFRALGTSPKTGFFSSGISTPLYWNFGMASTLSNAFCLNTSSASVAPEGGTIVFQAATAGTVTIPAGDLTVQRSSAGNAVQIICNNTETANVASSSRVAVSVNAATAGDPYVLIDNIGTTNYAVGLDNSDSDKFKIQYNTNTSQPLMTGTDLFIITSSGAVTEPLQPAFLAYLAATANNKTGNGASYTLGTDALTKVYDQSTSFNTNGTFTAPVTGIYDLRAQITVTGTTIATTFVISIVVSGTSARTYINTFTRAAGATDESVNVSVLAKMTATDTAVVTIVVSGEAADTDDILGAATAQTYFCGTLAC